MAKPNPKPAAKPVLTPPRDRGEAEQMIARIGYLQRQAAVVQTQLDADVAKLKADAETVAGAYANEIEQIVLAVEIWADKHREDLTKGDRTKTVKLATGEISWRLLPPAVAIRNAQAVLEDLLARGMERFVRTKREIDKAAMLAEPEIAAKIKGVSIQTGREQFAVTPAGMELSR